MTSEYSELERGFYFVSLNHPIQEELQRLLKHEARLVQGTRRRTSKPEVEWDKASGDGESGSRVFQAEGSVSKNNQKFVYVENPIQTDLKTLFNRFRFQLGIQKLPEESADFGRQHAGGKAKRENQSQPRGNNEGHSAEDETNKNNGRKRERKKLKSGRGGDNDGSGEDKRPFKVSSSSSPESASSSETVSETNEPATSSTGAKKSASTAPRRPHHKSRKKQRLDTSESNETSSAESGKQEEKEPKINKHLSQSMPQKKKKSKVDKEETQIQKGISFSTKLEAQEPQDGTHHKSSGRKPKKSGRSFSHAVRGPASISSIKDVAFKTLTEGEKDSEWLEWSSSEDETQDEDAKDMEKAKKNSMKVRPIQKDLQIFMDSTLLLDRINTIMGLNPYTKVVRNNQCVQMKWVPRSGEYIGVCLNALVFFMTTLGIFYSLITIFGYDTPLSDTHKLVKLDFAQHFLESCFLMLLTLFMTIWAVSCILELGVHYAEFYSRFNMGIVLTKYDLSEGIHEMILKHMTSVFLFELALIMLFLQGFVHTSIVRESCGFMGYLILRPFNFELRESIYYPLAEIFGLLVYLYCFLAMNVVLLHFTVHAKALGNMAKHFNLRLAYALGSLTEKSADGQSKHVRKVIPFKKLWAEHQIITSLFRHFSQVNVVVFGAFIFTMIGEIVLCMWLFFDIFLEEHPPALQGVSLERTGSVELAVPLRLQKNEGERLLKAAVIFSITWLMYWIFSGVMHNAGDALHIGMEYVRRYGLSSCKSSKEIRFILSMIKSFSPKSPYWIGRRFHFSRSVFFNLTNFVIGASMVTVAFRPERLSLASIELCNEYGVCQVLKVYKTAQHIVYATLNVDPPLPPQPTQPIGVLPPPGPPGEGHLYRYNSFLQTPPCASQGAYPVSESTVCGTVHTEWSFPVSRLKLPFLYKQKSVADPSATPPKQYTLFDIRTTVETLEHPLKNCYGEDLSNPPETDDCNNPIFNMPKRGDWFVKLGAPPEIQLIAVNQIPGYPDLNDERFFCCYKYAVSSDNEVKVCNMRNKAEVDSRCKLSAVSSPFIEKLMEKRKTGGGRDDLDFGVPFSDPIRKSWTNCLCKNDGNECEKLTKPTTTPTTTKSTTTTPTTTKLTTTTPTTTKSTTTTPTTTKSTTTTPTTTKSTTTTPTTTKSTTTTPTTTKSTTTTPTTTKSTTTTPTTTKTTTTTPTTKTTTTTPTTTTTTITTTKPKPPITTPRPPCFDYSDTPEDKKYLTKCDVQGVTGDWADLHFISVPTVFQKVKGAYIQVLDIIDSCSPTPIHTKTRAYVDELDPLFDCNEIEYKPISYSSIGPPQEFFVDDCNNLIIHKDGTRWDKLLKIRVVIVNKATTFQKALVACCVDYGLDPDQSRRQARVCSKPSRQVFEKRCKPKKENIREYVISQYIMKWEELEANPQKQIEFEYDEITVKCMCQSVTYVKKKYPPIAPSPSFPEFNARECRKYLFHYK